MGAKTLAIALGLVGFAMASGATGGTEPLRLSIGQAYAKAKCETSINRYLAHLKIAEDEVTNISVFSVKPTTGRLLGYRAWVSLKSCRGSLVINLAPHCGVIDTYTRADCRFEGVPRH